MYGADIGVLIVKAVEVGRISVSSSNLDVVWDVDGTPTTSRELIGQQQGTESEAWRKAHVDLRDWQNKTFRLFSP